MSISDILTSLYKAIHSHFTSVITFLSQSWRGKNAEINICQQSETHQHLKMNCAFIEIGWVMETQSMQRFHWVLCVSLRILTFHTVNSLLKFMPRPIISFSLFSASHFFAEIMVFIAWPPNLALQWLTFLNPIREDGFKSRFVKWLVTVFIIASRKILVQWLKIGHDHRLPHTLQLIIHYHTIRCMHLM